MKTPLPTDIYVGARIRLQRKRLQITQAGLGERLGITFQQIQKYENGTNRVGPSRIHRISEIFQVPVSFFFPDGGQRESVGKSDELSLFLQTFEGRELNHAFRRIRDSKVRRALVALAKSMADKKIQFHGGSEGK
ncbi:helix-turn-helix domain-containing protein [Pararhizobium sp. PWRC1-1]|uniref:helix-turn-helix domain-containing protein n=1 Tax=Pararhizobium sp. PWRC1-1 TaxID=2804566 RepID=UPI003CFA958E